MYACACVCVYTVKVSVLHSCTYVSVYTKSENVGAWEGKMVEVVKGEV